MNVGASDAPTRWVRLDREGINGALTAFTFTNGTHPHRSVVQVSVLRRHRVAVEVAAVARHAICVVFPGMVERGL